jgi:hypothetical protein
MRIVGPYEERIHSGRKMYLRPVLTGGYYTITHRPENWYFKYIVQEHTFNPRKFRKLEDAKKCLDTFIAKHCKCINKQQFTKLQILI